MASSQTSQAAFTTIRNGPIHLHLEKKKQLGFWIRLNWCFPSSSTPELNSIQHCLWQGNAIYWSVYIIGFPIYICQKKKQVSIYCNWCKWHSWSIWTLLTLSLRLWIYTRDLPFSEILFDVVRFFTHCLPFAYLLLGF